MNKKDDEALQKYKVTVSLYDDWKNTKSIIDELGIKICTLLRYAENEAKKAGYKLENEYYD